MTRRMNKVLLCLIALTTLLNVGLAFNPKRWSPYSGSGDGHYVISETAIDKATIDFLRKYGEKNGKPVPDGTPERVASYCSAVGLSCYNYDTSVATITDSNSRVDDEYTDLARYHFDAESFLQANTMLIKNKQAAIQIIRGSQSYVTARQLAGKSLHTLQDFYSHSNWIEMGEPKPNRHVTRSLADLGTIAKPDEATCSDCDHVQYSCRDNILEEILNNRILTSGYYGGQDIEKPVDVGKCSHGGIFDTSQSSNADGGINKDVRISVFSPHHYLQTQAVETASDATYHFFLDLWDIMGDDHFGGFLSLTEPETVVFAIDISATIGKDNLLKAIEAVKRLSENVRKSQPSLDYIVLPFSGRGLGFVFRSDNLERTKEHLNKLIIEQSPTVSTADPFEAISVLLSLSMTKSTFFVFTSASASVREATEDSIRSKLHYRNVVINFILADSYHNKESIRTMQQLAFESGGKFYDLADATKVRPEAQTVDSSSGRDVLLASISSNTDASVEFQVDPEMTDLVITADSPDGGLISVDYTVSPSQNENIVDSLPNRKTISVTNPSVANWEVRVSANKAYTLTVTGVNSLAITSSVGGQHTEESDSLDAGFISFEGEPISGYEGSVLADVSSAFDRGEIEDVKIRLTEEDGQKIETAIAQGDMAAGFIANVTFPRHPFKVVTEGKLTDGGHLFQRTNPRVFRPVPFIIRTVKGNDTSIDTAFMQVNISLALSLSLSYYGNKSEEMFVLSAIDTLATVTEVVPNSLTLGNNETGYFEVRLYTEDAGLIGYVNTITTFANSSDEQSNYVTKMLAVMPEFIDIIPPKFFDAEQDDGECVTNMTNCHDEFWTASVSFEEESGDGLHKYVVRVLGDVSEEQNATYKITVPEFEPGMPRADARLELECCIAEFEVLAIDGAGNLNSAYFYNSLRVVPEIVENGLEWWFILLIVLGSLLGVVLISVCIYFLVKRLKK